MLIMGLLFLASCARPLPPTPEPGPPPQPPTEEPIPPPTQQARCATYTYDGREEKHCATCGNGVCEPLEQCSPSTCSELICTDDCGGLYCPQDCEGETPEPELGQAQCEAQGGRWDRGFVGYFCNFPAADADKPCTDNAECQGMCMIENVEQRQGTCSAYQQVRGCVTTLSKGEVIGICID